MVRPMQSLYMQQAILIQIMKNIRLDHMVKLDTSQCEQRERNKQRYIIKKSNFQLRTPTQVYSPNSPTPVVEPKKISIIEMPKVDKKKSGSPKSIRVPGVPALVDEKFDMNYTMILPPDLQKVKVARKESLVIKNFTEEKILNAGDKDTKENSSRTAEQVEENVLQQESNYNARVRPNSSLIQASKPIRQTAALRRPLSQIKTQCQVFKADEPIQTLTGQQQSRPASSTRFFNRTKHNRFFSHQNNPLRADSGFFMPSSSQVKPSNLFELPVRRPASRFSNSTKIKSKKISCASTVSNTINIPQETLKFKDFDHDQVPELRGGQDQAQVMLKFKQSTQNLLQKTLSDTTMQIIEATPKLYHTGGVVEFQSLPPTPVSHKQKPPLQQIASDVAQEKEVAKQKIEEFACIVYAAGKTLIQMTRAQTVQPKPKPKKIKLIFTDFGEAGVHRNQKTGLINNVEVDTCRYLEYRKRALDRENRKKAKSHRDRVYLNEIIQKATWLKQNLELKLQMLYAKKIENTKEQQSTPIIEDPKQDEQMATLKLTSLQSSVYRRSLSGGKINSVVNQLMLVRPSLVRIGDV